MSVSFVPFMILDQQRRIRERNERECRERKEREKQEARRHQAGKTATCTCSSLKGNNPLSTDGEFVVIRGANGRYGIIRREEVQKIIETPVEVRSGKRLLVMVNSIEDVKSFFKKFRDVTGVDTIDFVNEDYEILKTYDVSKYDYIVGQE